MRRDMPAELVLLDQGSATNCFSRSLRPSRPARAPGSACRSATTSSPSSMAARSRWRASPARTPSSPSACRAIDQRQHLGEGMSVSILVVDDEPDIAELFRQRFRREARAGTYVMHFANSGEGALQLLGGGIEPQLIVILSDINMPGMDGLQLLGEVKRRFPHLPVMMVTAYGDDERRRRASELGAVEFITKPVDFDALKAHLRQLP